jgi:selenide,water dikinase
MVEASKAGVELFASRLPVLAGTLDLAERGQFSGGMRRNRRHVEAVFGPRLVIDGRVPGRLVPVLFEAETSGGLLFSVRPERGEAVGVLMAERGEECWEVGRVVDDPVIRIAG